MSQPLIDLKNITKSFDGTVVLDDLNLAVAENTFVTLLAPAAAAKPQRCGLSVALRLLTRDRSFSTGRTSASFRPTSAS